MKRLFGRGGPIGQLLEKLERNLRDPSDDSWGPLVLSDGPLKMRCAALLDQVLAMVPEAQKDYFRHCRDRYMALLSVLLPHVQAGWRVLDVGCAPGHLAMALDLSGCRVAGIDLNALYLPKYPSPEWIDRLAIRALDVERHDLPFDSSTFDAVLFTEVLEHVAIRRPGELMAEFKRILKPGGRLLLSTPNFANVSQILALSAQRNVMWAPDLFYGSTDRHNREYVGREVKELIEAHFARADYYLMNAEHNWNSATNDVARELSRRAEREGNRLPIFYNTLVVLALTQAD
jgi:2-polyprenyl-3-methyl-5-hydroxy-6-metoxy-1,4-benzoquinol methylase